MSTPIIIIFIAAIIFSGVAFLVLFLMKGSDDKVVAMKSQAGFTGKAGQEFPDERTKPKRENSSELTLAKKLYYASLPIPVPLYYALAILISIVSAIIVNSNFNLVLTICSLYVGPLVMGTITKFFMNRKFNRFNKDYAAFLMNLTSLLKTGMNAMTALNSAADSLDEDSLVREEIKLMIERLKFGVDEEKSIGSFAENIYHPEIELFVQAMLLSRKVGGSLADTLDRLARQVRKREQFRATAVAAVGMQRGSIWFILGIMVALELFIWFSYREAITGAWADPLGWEVWQYGILCILLGMRWVRAVTEFRI